MVVHGAPKELGLIRQARPWLKDAWGEKSLLLIPHGPTAKPHAHDVVSSQRGHFF